MITTLPQKSPKPKPLYSKTYTDMFVNKVTKSNKKILTITITYITAIKGDDRNGRK